jgi:hypothetical protein
MSVSLSFSKTRQGASTLTIVLDRRFMTSRISNKNDAVDSCGSSEYTNSPQLGDDPEVVKISSGHRTDKNPRITQTAVAPIPTRKVQIVNIFL